MKIFFDTNVLVDLLLERPRCSDARKILEFAKNDEYSRVCLSFLSVANAAYILRKKPLKDIQNTIRRVAGLFTILPCSDMLLLSAERISSPDYEDAIQIACAEQAECNVIITGNKTHFESYSSLPVLSAEEFVSMFS